VLNGAREGWRRQQEALRKFGGPTWLSNWNRQPTSAGDEVVTIEPTAAQVQEAIDRFVAQKLADHCDRLRRQPGALGPYTENLAGLIAALLKKFGSFEIERPPSGKPDQQFPFSLVVRQRATGKYAEARTGILFLPAGNATSTTAALRWLARATDTDRVLLVTDEGCPLVFGAQPDAKGREYYAELRGRDNGRFQHIELSVEVHAQLAAIQAVVGMARSGDLELDLPSKKPRAVSEQDVIESFRRQGQYFALPVIRNLFTEPESSKGIPINREQSANLLR
jgi:hypothetical protein